MLATDIDIELLTPVSLPARSRSLDDAGSRRTIPGAALLGACAKALHDALFADDAFRIFQTNAVIFGDGFPVLGDDALRPLPRSLHVAKHGDAEELLNLVDDDVRAQLLDTNTQIEPVGGFTFINDDATAGARIETEVTMRTSVHPGGRAAEGLLFTISTLPAGLVFRSSIRARDAADLDRVLAHLEGDRFIGRARGTELGRVRIRRHGTARPSAAPPSGASRLCFFAASSLALRDRLTGMPTLTPRAVDFGLPADWRLDAHASFIRVERYTPHHGKRNLPDLERQLIESGSVLTFSGPSRFDPEVLTRVLEGGVGEYRNTGLGAVRLLAGRLLEGRLPRPGVTSLFPDNAAAQAPSPSDELFDWARARATDLGRARELFAWAFDKADAAARWGLPPAQWGELRRRAREARIRDVEPKRFRAEIRRHLETGIAKLDKLWGQALSGRKLSDHLDQMLFEQLAGHLDPAGALEQLAELTVRKMPKEDRDESR